MLIPVLAAFKACSSEPRKAVRGRVRVHHPSISRPGSLFLPYTEALTKVSFEKGVLWY